MTLYGLTTCDTCRKALSALEKAGHEVALQDVRRDGLTEAQVARFHAELGENLLNRRSTTWRGLSEEERSGDPVALILGAPTLMKRPVIEDGDRLHLGWTAEVREALGA